MSDYKSTFRMFVKEGLKPQSIPSYAGSSLIVINNGDTFAFDPQGNSIHGWHHENYRDINELHWSFSFVSDKTQDVLRRCNKIILVGKPTDIYKIYFFTDDYRVFTVGLKAGGNTNLKKYLPAKLRKGRGKAFYNELISLPGSHAVTQYMAGRMLTDCPYTDQLGQYVLPHPLIFRWVKYLLCCDLTGEADRKIKQFYLTSNNALIAN